MYSNTGLISRTMKNMGRYGIIVVESEQGSALRYQLDAQKISIGRGPENDIVLLDRKVSRHHAALICNQREVILKDLGSSNGFVYQKKRVRLAKLQHGDRLRIGATFLYYMSAESELQDDETLLTAAGPMMDSTLSEAGSPRLIVVEGEQIHSVVLTGQSLSIGRSSKADLTLVHPDVSRIHAHVQPCQQGYEIIDNKSRNGIFVNGQKRERVLLKSDVLANIAEAQIFVRAAFDDADLSVVATRVSSQNPTQNPKRGAQHPGPQAAGSSVERPSIDRPSIELLGEQQGAQAPQAVPRRAPIRAVATGRQPVIVIPGFMGSTLFSGHKKIWPDVKRFSKNPEFLQLPENLDLQARGLVSEIVVVPGLVKLDAYNRLLQYLNESLLFELDRDLFAFAYDWRRDLRHAARQLGEQIASWEEQADLSHGKFVLVAHSAGALVARYYVERMGGRHHVDRLILIGSPNLGSLKTLSSMLTGQGLLPFGARKERLRDVLGTFPAAYQLLPSAPSVFSPDGEAIDLFADKDWVPHDVWPLVEDARAFISELGTRSRVPVVSIFGYGQKTIERITVKRDAKGRFISPRFHESTNGDGTVLQSSAVLAGSEIHPVRQQHGALYTDRDVKMRLRLELIGQ